MNQRSLILLAVAVVIAGMTAFGIKSRMTPDAAPAVQGTKVLVAGIAIPAGSFVLADKHLTWADWPKANLQPWHVVQGSRPAGEFNGAVARRNLQPGEPVSTAVLVKPGQGGFMSAVLTPGMVAVSIAVTPTSGNAGFIFPGDRVNLIVTHKLALQQSEGESGGSQKALVSETFVRDVRVLAVDQMLDNPENKATVPKTVTLEVSSKQAEAVSVAADMGKISVVLRSVGNAPEETAKAEAAPKPEAPEDPFFGGVTMDAEAEEEGTSFTRDSDVSPALGGSQRAYPSVQVFRGDDVKKVQFE